MNGLVRRPACGAAASELTRGQLVEDRYEVLQVLSDGPTATVCRVRHRVLGRVFALKALRSEAFREHEFSERFRREARALAALTHPSVVALTDYGHLPSGQPYFVMEYVDGVGLEQLIDERGPLDLALAVDLALGIADAVGAAHRAGIVHRDLKPSNVLLVAGAHERARRVKVLDFGLALISGATRLTRPNAATGTPEYMSPEQVRGRPADARSDIYAIGVTLFEMLSGSPPFSAPSYMALAQKHLYAPVPSLAPWLRGEARGRSLEKVVERCLEKRPERRFSSVEELCQALERVAEPEPTLRVSRGRVAPERSAPRRSAPERRDVVRHRPARRHLLSVWVLVGCAVGAALFYGFHRLLRG